MAILSKSELTKYKADEAFIKKVAAQVQKDFQLYAEKIEFNYNSEAPYDELIGQLKPIILRMLELDSARFFSLLYAIDVAEKKVREILFGREQEDVALELTHLILERELLKVATRQLFSHQSII